MDAYRQTHRDTVFSFIMHIVYFSLSLRSKRFCSVSEQKETVEGDFRFWSFFARSLTLVPRSLLLTAQKRLLRRLQLTYIRNIMICMGQKPIVSVTYENERLSIKNSLPYLKCVLRLSCVVHGPIYDRFMGFYVNGFLSKPLLPPQGLRPDGEIPRRHASSSRVYWGKYLQLKYTVIQLI